MLVKVVGLPGTAAKFLSLLYLWIQNL